MRFVFVSNADSGDIHVLSLSRQGELEPSSILSLGGSLMPMVLSPDQSHLYVARRSEPMAILTLAVDHETGRLSLKGECPLEASLAYLSLDVQGKHLFGASYQHDAVFIHPIKSDGTVAPPRQVLPTGRHAHSVALDRQNQFLFAAVLGSDELLQWPWVSASGTVETSECRAWPSPSGSGPRHFRMHPNGQVLYLLHELDAHIGVYRFNSPLTQLQLTQSVPTLPAASSATPWASELHVTRNGKFLYSSERGSHTLAVFAIDSQTYQLQLVEHFLTESQPRGFCLSPDDKFLLVAGQTSNHVSCYGIDPDTGCLRLLQRIPVGTNPNWIEITL
jgi:6-phosphogluconolactonase